MIGHLFVGPERFARQTARNQISDFKNTTILAGVLLSRQGLPFHSCRGERVPLHNSVAKLRCGNPPNVRQGSKSRCLL